MKRFDTIIRNGWIVDGTGGPAGSGDVGITDGKVITVGALADCSADEEIDADGRIVAPGHITQHSHYDAAIFWSPSCLESGEHGVTSVLNANCGFGLAPARPSDRERLMLMLSTTEQVPVEQQRLVLPWDWESFPEFMDRLRALPKSVNVLTYLPVNPLLIYVMGIDGAKSRRPTADEMADLHRLINEAMDGGATGIAMSVMGIEGNTHVDYDGTPMPTDVMHIDDIVELARALVDRGEGIVQLLSQIGPWGNRDISARVARMARGSGVRVFHNIFAAIDGMPELIDADLAWLDELRAEGCDIVASTILHAGWIESDLRSLDTAGGQIAEIRRLVACRDDAERLELLSDPSFVKSFSDEHLTLGIMDTSQFPLQTVIETGPAPELAGYRNRTLGEIAEAEGRTVIEVLCDLGVRSGLALRIKSRPFTASDANLGARLLSHPAVASGVSDGGAHTKSFSSGSYATEMLIRMVREQQVFTLEAMHHQLSFKVARALNLADRGAILPGQWADIVIYRLEDLYLDREKHAIVYDMPGGDWRYLLNAGGYHRILVNGVTTHLEGESTGSTPGHFGATPRLLAAAV